jgi:predicted RNase H-like HicB family nuclease
MTTTMVNHQRLSDLLRMARCYQDEHRIWICEIPGEENLWAFGRTPEEAMAELAALLEEEMEPGEAVDDQEEEALYSLVTEDMTPPGPFGIPWRWILIPAGILVFLLLTLVVGSSPAETTVPTPVPTVVSPYQGGYPREDPYQEIRSRWEQERRLQDLERRQSICSDPTTPPSVRWNLCP